MKVLVLAQNYPSEANLYSQAFIHSRNVIYKANGVEVEVCSFASKEDYEFDGIKVLSPDHVPDLSKYDLILSHAPNLRNHFRFLIFRWREFRKIVFFFHGYEVMDVQKYVQPYFGFLKPNLLRRTVSRLYDKLKLPVIRTLLQAFVRFKQARFITVSNTFLGWIQNDLKMELSSNTTVIPNSINPAFENNSFIQSDKRADFISIRPFDEPKYAVDLLVNTARSNPQFTFHLYGRGKLFEFINKPDNLTVFTNFIKQSEIPVLLNSYNYALMLSRCDAQGVMACEMATYGIPMIVSDMPVFHEVLGDFENVAFLSNNLDTPLEKVLVNLKASPRKNLKFSSVNTVAKEIELMQSLVDS